MDRINDGEVECDTEQEAMEYARDRIREGMPDYEIHVERIEEEGDE